MTQTRYTMRQHAMNLRSRTRLSHINIYHCDDNTANITPGHPYLKLIYIENGEGEISLSDITVPVKANDVLVLRPSKERFSVLLSSNTMDFTILGIEGLLIESSGSQEIKKIEIIPDVGQPVQDLMEKIIWEVSLQQAQYETACIYYLQNLLIELERESTFVFRSPVKEKKARDCTFIKDYLDTHYTENISLDALSEQSNMNKYYLVHSFTKTFGCSPINYLNEKRIEESKRLLESTNYSIAEIASLIGFSSQSYFSQAFKKNTFMTPNEYRHSAKYL